MTKQRAFVVCALLLVSFLCFCVANPNLIDHDEHEYPLSEPVEAVIVSQRHNVNKDDTQQVQQQQQQQQVNSVHPLLNLVQKASGPICIDYTIEGYYSSRVYKSGNPPSGYDTRPIGITPCQLEMLHTQCVKRINMYRSGQLKFSDGTSDSNVVAGLTPYVMRKGSNQCSSSAAMGDLIDNYKGGGGCAGAHNNAFVCPSSGGGVAQNSCCGRGGGTYPINTYDAVQSQLFSCLQQMWDEGMASNSGGQTGHWKSMRSTAYRYVSCGFAWSSEGRVMMTQDFFTSDASCTPACTSCKASDGCSHNPCNCNTTSNANGNGSDKHSGLSGGAAAGITICVIFVVAAGGFAAWRYRGSIRRSIHFAKAAVRRRRVVVMATKRNNENNGKNDFTKYVAAPSSTASRVPMAPVPKVPPPTVPSRNKTNFRK